MMYTEEQVRIARNNTKNLVECPKWLQKMFMEAPNRFTLTEVYNGWSSGYDGDCPDIAYRISTEWPPNNEIIVELPSLEPVEMFVSDNNVDWFTAAVIGKLSNDDIIALQGPNIERWAYVKPIEEQKYKVIVKIKEPTHDVNSRTILSAIRDGIDNHLEVDSDVEINLV